MNKYFIYLLAVSCFFVSNIEKLTAQTETDFWFVAPDADITHGTNGDRPTFFMITTGNLPADVTIDMPKNSAFTKAKKHIPANSYWKYSFEGNDVSLVENLITDAGKVTNKGVHITSTAPVSVYYQVDGPVSKEIFTLKGEKALGKKFYTPFQTAYKSYEGRNGWAQIHIVATQDNTAITLKPTANIVPMVSPNVGTGLIGSTNTITLNKGETFVAKKVIRDKEDPTKLSGSYIESDKPIAVTIADDVVDVSQRQDICGDQLVPVDGLGTNYVVVKGYTSLVNPDLASDYIYVVATQDGTTIKVQGDVVADINTTINAGQTYKIKMGYSGEASTNNACYITTSKPAYCLHQSGVGGEIGASILPSMYSIASRQITLYNAQDQLFNNLVFIFHDDALNSFSINGKPLTLTDVKSIPGLTGWKYAKSNVLNSSLDYKGAIRISNSKGAFSLGYFYGNTGGTALYGFLSNYGAFSFDADTVYKCKGDSFILDGGYAKAYEWKNAAGTVVGSSQKYTVTTPGKYTLKLDQDGTFAYDTIWVLDRNFSTAKIVYTGINPQKIYINESGTSSAKSYVWKLNNGAITYTTDTITVDWASISNKNIEVKISDIASGCDTTLTGTYAPVELPDNISDADCVLEVIGTNFDINKVNTAVGLKVLHAYCAPIAGDLDGNKIPDVVALGYRDDTYAENIYIYFDTNRANPKVITTPLIYSRNIGGIATARVKIAADTISLIVVHGTDQYLYAYDANGDINQLPVWISSTVTGVEYTTIGFADFNNDGVPEVYAGKKIYNAVTGFELVASPGNYGLSSFSLWPYNLPAIADVYGDAKLEYIAGNQVYEVNIVNKTDNTAGVNTMSLVKELTGAEYTDGVTVVADFNRDGKLDVAVRVIATPNSRIYIWDVENEQLIAQGSYPKGASLNSVPFIGDIDGNGDLEIIVASEYKLNVFDYNGTTALAARTPIPIGDRSGGTGITLFDFNQDGTAELVYRDEQNLYIYNVVGSTLVVQETMPCGSLTVFECPIVLDVDGDGSAEIVVIGGGPYAKSGFLHILKSKTPGTWGPARKVWNQYAYNAVNVNEDLTIPKVQFNPATVFPGADGVLGTSDDVRPYNAFLQQQTILNKNGNPLWLAPAAKIADSPKFTYDAANDSMLISVKVKNSGEVALQSPFNITVYKDAVGNAKKLTHKYEDIIRAGDSLIINFGIPKFKADWTPFTDLVIQINDNGNGYNDQAVCDSLSRGFKSGAIIASDDNTLLFENSIDNKIQVTLNDIKPCNNPKIEIVTEAKNTRYLSTIYNDSVIVYTPDQSYEGLDSIKYLIHCGDITKADTATLYIKVIKAPDNISDATCVTTPPASAWGIREVPNNLGDIFSNLQTTLVADIDGDKIPEILALATAGDKVYVLNGDGTLKATSAAFTTNPIDIKISYGGANPLAAVARVQWLPNNYKTVIFTTSSAIATADRKLRAYDVSDGTLLWTSTALFNDGIGDDGASVQVIDLDGDGWSELVIGNKVFSAEKGILLCSAGTNSGVIHGWGKTVFLIHSMAGDVLGNGKQQVCVGNTIYEVNITNRAVSGDVNTMTPAKTITPIVWNGTANETLTTTDGAVQLADIDLDGNIDIIVSTVKRDENTPTNSIFYMYVWSPSKNEIIASKKISRVYKRGVPFIGNIDKTNPYPEIIFTRGGKHGNIADLGYDKVTALQYDPSSVNKELKTFWELDHDDVSGATGITLFDFNQDKISELVYRDNKHLRIINGSGLHHVTGAASVPYDLATINCSSATCYEYPVVADVDGDGQAEIVVTGNVAADHKEKGPIRIFKAAAGTSWAPARKVWNQYPYNAVHVNEDLTTVKYPMNPATIFPGKDGVLGTADDTRPYNAFLQQQTMLNKFGSPLWLAANAQKLGVPSFIYDVGKDSLIVTIKIHNAGSAALQDPVKVTAYKNNIGNALKYTYAYLEKIMPGDSATISFGISKFKEKWTPFNNIVIQINDNGNGYNDQPVCDSLSRDFKSGKVIASDDRVLLFKNSSNNQITVTLNDIKSCIDPKVTIVTPPKHALSCTVVNDSVIQYSPATDYIGNDTLRYKVACGTDSYEATVYITVVEKPDNISDADCVGNVPAYEWGIFSKYISAARYSAYFAPLIGDVTGDGIPNIIVAVGDLADVQYSKEFHVLRGDDYSFVKKINTALVYIESLGPAAIVKIKDKYLFFVWVRDDQKIRAYNIATNTLEWTSAATVGDMLTSAISVSLADFDNDGTPEIYAGNKIFDVSTGKLLWSGSGNQGKNDLTDFNKNTNMLISFAADVIGDAKLELVAGCHVYDVVIDRVSPRLNVAPVRSIPAPKVGTWQLTKGDGLTQVADINNDGKLDIVVNLREDSKDQSAIYVWDPRKEELIASRHLTSVEQAGFMSFPFIGDINGDGRPEIVVVYQKSPSPLLGGKMQAFSYVDGNTTLQPNWSPAYPITEYYARTGMTLFDFDQNGTFEIVYRDAEKLRIIDGSGTNPKNLITFPCYSGTGYEYPVIADIDNDGQAEIITVGATTSTPDSRMHVFTAPNTTKWAPARKVWNQYTYNAVNVNDDLTIPKVQLNPATVFPGKDGVLGTADDVRPFNGFLQQQTILNKNGTPLWLLPNAQIKEQPIFSYDVSKDSLTVAIKIHNAGEAALQNPVKVTAYKDNVGNVVKYTYAYPEKIMPGDSATITFGIEKFKEKWTPFSDIVIQINDNGNGYNDQPVCDSLSRDFKAGKVIASDDRVLLFKNSSDNRITVTLNDIKSCIDPKVTIVTPPKHALSCTVVNDSVIQYSPATDYTGSDTIRYKVTCGADSHEAMVYITVIEKPDNISDANCFIKPEVKTFTIKEHTNFGNVHSMSTPLVANLSGNGAEIIVPKVKAGNKAGLSNGLVIANVKDNTRREISTVDFATHGQSIVIADVDKDGKCEIFIQNTANGAIHCYNPDGTAKSGFGSGGATIALSDHYVIQLADLNNDGNVELIAGTYIFDAKTGALKLYMIAVADGRGFGNPHALPKNNASILLDGSYFMPAIGDVDGDGSLEIVGGSTVYKPNAALNGYTTTSVDKISAPAAFKKYWDGPTVLVDFDLDGQLDVCVIGHEHTGAFSRVTNHQLYVWNPKTQQIIAYAPAVISTGNPTIPYVGDLDNNGYPDIAFATNGIGMATFQYDKTQPGNINPGPVELRFAETAGFTMFDFNQDGKAEIVYRGTSEFFIVDLNDAKNAYVELSPRIPAWSGTVSEYPIVADVDGDGQAEIILTRAYAKWGTDNLAGVVSVYKTGDATKPWAPARPVWNQWNYNSVNINDDMTIPRFQLNPSTVFPGEDGVLGTSDDTRPYNAFLQQQTMLNKFGSPLWLAADYIISGTPSFTHSGSGDSLVISLCVENKGDAQGSAPFNIALYNKERLVSKVIATQSYPNVPQINAAPICYQFIINNFSAHQPVDSLLLYINDAGKGVHAIQECDSTNSFKNFKYSNMLLAINDTASLITGSTVVIDQLANDSIPATCTTIKVEVFANPKNGTTTLGADNKISYTPNAGFVGYDTLTYKLYCTGLLDTAYANIYVKVYSKPDNIVDPGACNILMPAFDFKIKQQWETVNEGHSNTGTLVGDLDGDGLPEIIAYSPSLSAVNIYNGQSGAFIDSIKFPGAYFGGAGGWLPHMTSILVDADRNGLAEIIGVDTKTRDIYSYEADTTGGVFSLKLKWKTTRPFENSFPTDNFPHLNVADFNGDSIPELLIYNQIYNAVTGAFLGETEPMATAHKGCDPGRLTEWNKSSNFQTTADFDGDGYPEIVAGGKVYKVHINPITKALDSCTILKEHVGVPDGFTAVADIDMDGNLDVVVVSTSVNTVSLYVWSPLTAWMTKKDVYMSTSYPAHSFPFIGDIDGFVDGVTGKTHPEICVVTSRGAGAVGPYAGYVRAYKYDSSTKTMVEKWILGTSDVSGGTGITLFDFNNDGINELVYRDQTHLRILNGVDDNTEPVLAPGAEFACYSRTAFEYPVIADTDGDGSANICVTCREEDNGIGAHYLRVYESASQPWAPTRRVWNQVNYEPLQINEDLTVPKMAIPKNMEFNGKHPYNGALIQIPIVDENFNPVIPAPDPATAGMKLEAINATTLRVWLEIENKGQRFTNVSLPISLYHTDTVAANIINTKPIGISLAPNDTVTLYWDIPLPVAYTKFIVRIQDDGLQYPADGSYFDCDYTNNIDSINVLLAINDTVSYINSGTVNIDVLANDLLASCNSSTLTAFDVVPNSGLNNGTIAVAADNTFNYSFNVGDYGVDSVDYYIKCNADSSAARVYILVNKPNALNYIACLPQENPSFPNLPLSPTIVSLGFTSITGVTYTWYPTKTSTIPVTGGVNKDTLKVEVENHTDFGSWWVEPIWNGIKFERMEVTLSESKSCGGDLSDCAKDGTVLFREDFGGNNPADPIVRLTGIPEVSTPPYVYNSDHTDRLGDSRYTITKQGRGGGGTDKDWWRVPDHKYPGETRNGYMLQVNANRAPGQYYERELTGLCAGSKLFFSAWIINVQRNVFAPDKVNARFLIEHNNIVIAEYTTGAILESKANDTTDVKWRMYGFDFIVPVGIDNLKLRVINDGTGSSGNDFAMDDIEIRFCAPKIDITPGKDSLVCQGSRLDLNSSYTDMGEFGQDLKGRWERLDEGDGLWKLYRTEFSSNNGVINLPITINSFQALDEGYYRVVIASPSSIDKPNCRAVSDSVRFMLREIRYEHPDIRVQTCTDIGNINLSSYLDTVDFRSVQWFTSADVLMGNELNTGTLTHANTYKYKYKIKNSCYSPEGILYLKTLTDKSFNLPPDSVVICYKYANELHLNRIFGLEAKGTIEAEHAAIDNYVETAVSPAPYYGATIFDGKAVYENAAISGVAFDYNGPLTSGIAKKVTFKYTPAAGSCLAGKVYRLTVILTDDIL